MAVTLIPVITASFLASVVTGAGILVTKRFEDRASRYSSYLRSFAAGILITVTLTHLLPESAEMQDDAPVYWLSGFLGIYLLNHLLNLYLCQGEACPAEETGVIPAVGIAFHSLVDGIIYAVTFQVSVFTGILAAIGMVLHEFPEGIVTFLLLKESGLEQSKAMTYALLMAALSTPLGTLISLPLVRVIDRAQLGALLGLTAGVLIYVAASHLLPEVQREGKRYSIVAFFAGVLAAVVIVLSHG